MRIAAKIEYNGTNYHGFERQKPETPTIQQQLELAFSQIADNPIKLTVAGRTDAGVHATGQVVHFDTPTIREANAWVRGTNSILPKDICVLQAQQVADDFHARFSATARTYQYHIINRHCRTALNQNNVYWVGPTLNIDKMQKAVDELIGEHDFTSFRAKSCQANSPNRNVQQIKIEKTGDKIITTIKANAFLHHMVRNIMGSLLLVGTGKKPVNWLGKVLQAKDRSIAGATIHACGLRLVAVEYPKSVVFSS